MKFVIGTVFGLSISIVALSCYKVGEAIGILEAKRIKEIKVSETLSKEESK